MLDTGIRELKARMPQVLRAVKEYRIRNGINAGGKLVAMLVPADVEPRRARAGGVWARLEQLGPDIANHWRGDKSAAELLSGTRR